MCHMCECAYGRPKVFREMSVVDKFQYIFLLLCLKHWPEFKVLKYSRGSKKKISEHVVVSSGQEH